MRTCNDEDCAILRNVPVVVQEQRSDGVSIRSDQVGEKRGSGDRVSGIGIEFAVSGQEIDGKPVRAIDSQHCAEACLFATKSKGSPVGAPVALIRLHGPEFEGVENAEAIALHNQDGVDFHGVFSQQRRCFDDIAIGIDGMGSDGQIRNSGGGLLEFVDENIGELPKRMRAFEDRIQFHCSADISERLNRSFGKLPHLSVVVCSVDVQTSGDQIDDD